MFVSAQWLQSALPSWVPPLASTVIILCLFSAFELCLGAYVQLWLQSSRFRLRCNLLRRHGPRTAALARAAWITWRAWCARGAAGAAAVLARDAAGLDSRACYGLLWTSLIYQVPFKYHVPSVCVEAALIFATSALSGGTARAAPLAMATALARVVAASSGLVLAVQWLLWGQRPFASEPDGAAAAATRSAPTSAVSTKSGSRSSSDTPLEPWMHAQRARPAGPLSAESPASEPPTRRADRACVDEPDAAASAFVSMVAAATQSVEQLCNNHVEELREAAMAGAAQQFGYSVAAAVAEAPMGVPVRPYVPYRSLCSHLPVGIKVNSQGSQGFDAISSLLTTTLMGTAAWQLGVSGARAAPVVSTVCIAGCVQLLGSVIHTAGSQDPAANRLIAAVREALTAPLAQLAKRLGLPPPAVSVSPPEQPVEGASAGGGGGATTLLACHPPCLVRGQAANLRLLVRRPRSAAPVAARVVMFDVAGAVLLDQEAGQLDGGLTVISLVSPPVTSDVAQVALLLDGTWLAFLQPLPVLPPQPAAELQQHWVAALAAAAPSADDSAWDVRSPHAAAAFGSSLRPRHVEAAWQQHMAPLLLDLAYVCSGGEHGSEVAAALVAHVAQCGMWSLALHVVTLRAQQPAQGEVLRHGRLITVARRLVARGAEAVRGVAARVCPPVVGVWNQGSAAATAQPAIATSQPTGSSAGGVPVGGALASQALLLWRGFEHPGREPQFHAFVACLLLRSDYLFAALHLAVGLMCVHSYWHDSQAGTAAVVVTAAAHVLPCLVLLMRQQRMGRVRRACLQLCSLLYLAAFTLMALSPSWFPLPAKMQSVYSARARWADHAAYVVKIGVFDPLVFQTGWRFTAAVHAAHVVVAGALSLRYGTRADVVIIRQALTLVLGLAVAAASELALRNMFARHVQAAAQAVPRQLAKDSLAECS